MAIRKKRSSFDLLVFLFIIAIALGSYSSYSKYTSSVSGNSSVDIAAWKVSVNTEEITNKARLDEELTFVPIGSTYVANGKIAPSLGGYFDIIVDTTEAEVAATYTVTIDVTNAASLGGLSVVGYQVYSADDVIPTEVNSIPDEASLESVANSTKDEEVEGEVVTKSYSTISGRKIYLKNNKGQVETLRVFLKWDENGVSTSSSSIEIPVDIVVEQYYE